MFIRVHMQELCQWNISVQLDVHSLMSNQDVCLSISSMHPMHTAMFDMQQLNKLSYMLIGILVATAAKHLYHSMLRWVLRPIHKPNLLAMFIQLFNMQSVIHILSHMFIWPIVTKQPLRL